MGKIAHYNQEENFLSSWKNFRLQFSFSRVFLFFSTQKSRRIFLSLYFFAQICLSDNSMKINVPESNRFPRHNLIQSCLVSSLFSQSAPYISSSSSFPSASFFKYIFSFKFVLKIITFLFFFPCTLTWCSVFFCLPCNKNNLWKEITLN